MGSDTNIVITPEIIDGAIQEIRVLMPYWRSGFSGPQEKQKFIILNGAPFRGYRRFGRLTWHEETLLQWTPGLDPQVTFGTGRGGWAKWGCASFTADFVDREGNIVYEVDGPAHRGKAARQRDARKEAFLTSLGFEVLRIHNALIERWSEEAIRHYGLWKAGQVKPDPIQITRAEIVLQRLAAYKAERDKVKERVEEGNRRFGVSSTVADHDTAELFSWITEMFFGGSASERSNPSGNPKNQRRRTKVVRGARTSQKVSP